MGFPFLCMKKKSESSRHTSSNQILFFLFLITCLPMCISYTYFMTTLWNKQLTLVLVPCLPFYFMPCLLFAFINHVIYAQMCAYLVSIQGLYHLVFCFFHSAQRVFVYILANIPAEIATNSTVPAISHVKPRKAGKERFFLKVQKIKF